jgi:DNA (cytosine-5)-methyltransferase 1
VVGSLAARDFKDGRDLITHSLSASHGSEDGTGRGTPIIAFSAKDHGADALEDCSPTLRSCGEYGVNGGPAPAVAIRTAHTGANGHGLAENVEHTLDQAQAQAVAFTPIADSLCASYGTKWIGNASADNGSQFAAVAIRTATIPMHDMVTRHAGTDGSGHQCGKGHGLGVGDPGDPGDPMFTLGAADKHSVAQGMAVRRLTPRECERLMGISDDYTLIPWRGKMASDGPRYKAIGNSWAVPVLNWIAKRLIGVDAVMTRRQMM